jgi:hypothetical protein
VGNTNFLIFNRVFSQSTFMELINNYYPIPYNVAIERSSIDTKNKTNGKIISEIYKFMENNYRNEYIYKNTLLNKLLISTNNHSIENTTALTEIPVGKSKADFILINGKAEVYEIKTELDNFNRLESQIHDYYRAFDHVNIVTSPNKLDELREILSNSKTGIYVLDNKLKLQKIKKAKTERRFLEHKSIFKILRKKEYENILIKYYGKLPEVSQFDYYKECLKKFGEIDLKNIYSLFTDELKKRHSMKKDCFSPLSYPINLLVYFSNIRMTDINKISMFLNSTYNYGGRNVLSIS